MKGHSNTQNLCPERDAAVSKRNEHQGCEVRTEIGNTAAEYEIAENDKMYGAPYIQSQNAMIKSFFSQQMTIY